MVFDWSAECGLEDAVLVVPWSDANDPSVQFIDLREDPYAADEIQEAELYPQLLQALRALNGSRSAVFTAKCDAWVFGAGPELDAMRTELDLASAETECGFASYIDLLWRDRTIFASFHQHEHLVHRIARRAEPLDHPLALLQCVIRPAMIDLAGAQEGFAISLYVRALGINERTAIEAWSSALESAVAILRSKDLTPTT